MTLSLGVAAPIATALHSRPQHIGGEIAVLTARKLYFAEFSRGVLGISGSGTA
jgi:hypothetical protein